MSGGVETTRVVGRYAIFQPIASGGMATVYLGRLLGPVGFARTVAIKRLHPQYASEPRFVSMFLDEARLAARIRHPNVVPTLDVVATDGELFLVMEYVHGESLGKLVRAAARREATLPIPVVVAVMSGALQGLHAAHEAKSERGVALNIIHRDVSPQNILVGRDGQARLLDFGVARAEERLHQTQEGQVKGKVAYMAPEQLRGEELGPATDVYAAAVVMWEALTGKRLYSGTNDGALVVKVLEAQAPRPSEALLAMGHAARAKEVAPFDDIVMRALAPNKGDRWQSARELSRAIEATSPSATAAQVSDWVEATVGPELRERASIVAEIESSSAVDLTQGAVSAIGRTADETVPELENPPSTTADPQPPTVPFVTAKDPNRPPTGPVASPERLALPPEPARIASPPRPAGPLPATPLSASSPLADKDKDLRLAPAMSTLLSAPSPLKPGSPAPPLEVSVASESTRSPATVPPSSTTAVRRHEAPPPARSRQGLKVFLAVLVLGGLVGGLVAYAQVSATRDAPRPERSTKSAKP